jgi:signal transduction histidine kinase
MCSLLKEKNMQITYSAQQIDAWLEQATKGLPAKRLADIFGNALKTISKKASYTLNRITLMAIFKRVLFRCREKYPLLENIKVDSNGISIEQFSIQFDKEDPAELFKAFRYLFQELFSILGNLTANIVTTSLQNQQISFLEMIDAETLRESGGGQLVDVNYREEIAIQRLDSLYEMSKHFATFENVEKTFPEILISLSTLFSFKTILLLEKKDNVCVTNVWFDANADEESINKAINDSKNFYDYLVSPIGKDVENNNVIIRHELPLCSLVKTPVIEDQDYENKYITLPLSLSSLENFGLLQFENMTAISESDLLFINAMANLIAVTLDRFNKEEEATKMREKEIHERTDELEETQNYVMNLEKEREMREQFVATLTHDLRTPLTAAKMGAQFILRRPENIEKNQQLAVKIIRNIDRMDQMIRDLLDASRIRAGESLALTMTYCDLREIAIVTLRDLGIAYGDSFMLEMQHEDIHGFWNEEGIRRVIENLASNAIKYGIPQQLVTVQLKQTEENVQIIVHNLGNPISPRDQKCLFEPFHRTTSAQLGGKKGWGLGLTLVRGVVQAHGGTVSLTSSEDEGTNFIVAIPKDSRPFQILN